MKRRILALIAVELVVLLLAAAYVAIEQKTSISFSSEGPNGTHNGTLILPAYLGITARNITPQQSGQIFTAWAKWGYPSRIELICNSTGEFLVYGHNSVRFKP